MHPPQPHARPSRIDRAVAPWIRSRVAQPAEGPEGAPDAYLHQMRSTFEGPCRSSSRSGLFQGLSRPIACPIGKFHIPVKPMPSGLSTLTLASLAMTAMLSASWSCVYHCRMMVTMCSGSSRASVPAPPAPALGDSLRSPAVCNALVDSISSVSVRQVGRNDASLLLEFSRLNATRAPAIVSSSVV